MVFSPLSFLGAHFRTWLRDNRWRGLSWQQTLQVAMQWQQEKTDSQEV